MTERSEKSKPKSEQKGGYRFKPGPDPKRGRGPKKGAPNAGRPPDEFKALMREIASRPEAIQRIRDMVQSGEDAVALAAHKHAVEQGYGKATQPVELSGGLTVKFE